MKKKTLYERTLALAANTKLTSVRIAKDNGFTVRWLDKVKSGEIKDPGVKRTEKLHNYLKKYSGGD